MGMARFRSANIAPPGVPAAKAATVAGALSHPVALAEGADVVDAVLQDGCWEYRFTFVDVGNPHCVIFVQDPADFDVAGVGRRIERHPLFPNRVNVEFVRMEADGSASMRVWERGVGETQACGTGATAVGAACVRLGLARSPVRVRLPGGDLTIEAVAPGAAGAPAPDAVAPGAAGAGLRVFMTGPAEEVFTGRLSADLLRRLGWPATTEN
jgi:diaminopimelate epimerase